MRRQLVADLFCGCGGTSTGVRRAFNSLGLDYNLKCVNHWPVAIETHKRNHPEAQHYCVNLESAHPEELVPEGYLDLLLASPTCTYFSRARGGRPVYDQQRMDPWIIVRWCTTLRVKRLVVENVPEFVSWGPLHMQTGRPLKSRQGEYFRTWVQALEGIGMRVEWRILTAADYGDATTRSRFILMGRSDGRKITWPAPTHSPDGGTDLFGNTTEPWRSAREIIDWSTPGRSIFERKRPLAEKTLRRIAAGIRKYVRPPFVEPFLTILNGGGNLDGGGVRSLDRPLPVITAQARHFALVEPFLIGQQSSAAPRSVNQPVPTIATGGGISLTQPFIVPQFGERSGQQPRTHDITKPLPTPTGHGAGALVEPFIMGITHSNGAGQTRSIDQPISTVVAKQELGIVEPVSAPFITSYYGSSQLAKSIDAPLDTITTKDRHALVEPRMVVVDGQQYELDIRFRMLNNNELAQAMSFSDGQEQYEFVGTGQQITRQIGNAVPVGMATALATSIMEQ